MLELQELRRQQELQVQRQATPVGCSPGIPGKAYGRYRLPQEGGRSHAGSDLLPSWAKAARPLPPLLSPARAQQQQPTLSTYSDTVIPCSGGDTCLACDGGLEATALPQSPCTGRQAADDDLELLDKLAEVKGRTAEMGYSRSSSSSTSASLTEQESLLKRLQRSLARLDGELAARSTRRQQQGDVCHPAVPVLGLEAAEVGKVEQVAVTVTTAAPGAAEVPSCTVQRVGDGKVALQAQLPVAGSPHRPAAPGPQQPGVQEPLHWRLKSRSMVPTWAAAACASSGSRAQHHQRLPPMGSAQMRPTSSRVHVTPAAHDGTCYIDVANVGKPSCRIGSHLLPACEEAGAAQVAPVASADHERSRQHHRPLPPLHRPAAHRMVPRHPNLPVQALLGAAAWRNWQEGQNQWQQQRQQQKQQQSWQWQGQQAWKWHNWQTSWQFAQHQSVLSSAGNSHAWLQQQQM